jgi:hypothetical protein
MLKRLVAVALLGLSVQAAAQQVADPEFVPQVASPNWPAGRGPLVMIDEAHFNFHTATGRYEPFAKVARADGYRVEAFKSKFSAESLKQADILVIANASSESLSKDWSSAATPAFTNEEVDAVREWVSAGGRLFLIVDHMPMPGAAENLVAAFGAKWNDGYAQDPKSGGIITFRRSDGALADHPITNGRNAKERIESITTFAGSAFQAQAARPLFTLSSGAVAFLPKVPGRLEPGTPSVSVGGWLQGAVLDVGKGRVALFGEAAMLSAQVIGPGKDRFGMNSDAARQNAQFLVNTLHWLSGVLEPER